jgi:hypothetical protein
VVGYSEVSPIVGVSCFSTSLSVRERRNGEPSLVVSDSCPFSSEGLSSDFVLFTWPLTIRPSRLGTACSCGTLAPNFDSDPDLPRSRIFPVAARSRCWNTRCLPIRAKCQVVKTRRNGYGFPSDRPLGSFAAQRGDSMPRNFRVAGHSSSDEGCQ